MLTRPWFCAGRVLAKSLRVWARNVVPFTFVSALTFGGLLVLSSLLPEPRRTCKGLADILLPLACLIGVCLFWLATPAAMIHGVLQQARGERVSIAGCLRLYVKRLLPVLRVGFLIGCIGIPVSIGIGLLVQPLASLGAPDEVLQVITVLVAGAVMSCLYWVAVPVAAVENPGAVASLRRSTELIRGALGPVFVISFITLALQTVPLLLLDTYLGTASGRAGEWTEIGVAIVLSAPGAVACAVGYHELRAAKESATEALVGVFA